MPVERENGPMADKHWATATGITPQALDDEALAYLASVATRLRVARRTPSSDDVERQAIGRDMVRLLAHIAHLEG